ncbi:hypothetical protein SKAU_G00318490 [Synaphobranchus kaupii]|uniref:Uncharacterized protein n=1 Tax=Synaphobranchus kaupii TaxID=118154 RepID=A0A9Q1ET21_SYNKA|nr:hypothetical protein SKAU_G00318490 [Synaphobranchus kaupii]
MRIDHWGKTTRKGVILNKGENMDAQAGCSRTETPGVEIANGIAKEGGCCRSLTSWCGSDRGRSDFVILLQRRMT